MELLCVEGLTRRFGGLTAVDGLSFTVQEGEILSLIGPNGAGKSTVFNLLSGVLRPSRGRVIFRGRVITGLKPYRIARLGMGRTFQIMQPFRTMSVMDNVLTGVLFRQGWKGNLSAARREALRVCHLVGLADKTGMPAGNLNVAGQKRLEMARALAGAPRLLLLDEVMAGLNPAEVAEAMQLVERLRSEEGITVLLIEHVMKVVMGISDRIVVIHHGQKIAEGLPREIAENPRVIEAYLGQGRGEA